MRYNPFPFQLCQHLLALHPKMKLGMREITNGRPFNKYNKKKQFAINEAIQQELMPWIEEYFDEHYFAEIDTWALVQKDIDVEGERWSEALSELSRCVLSEAWKSKESTTPLLYLEPQENNGWAVRCVPHTLLTQVMEVCDETE